MDSALWSWNDTFALILTGIIVVFIALVLLIFIIQLMGNISVSLSNKSKPSQSQIKPPEVKQVLPTVPVAKKTVIQDGIEEEVVAVISAAVLSMNTPDTTYKITDIKKSPITRKASRNAWGMAGQMENTRPF